MEYKIGNKDVEEKHYVSYRTAIECAIHYFNEKLKAVEWAAFKDEVFLVVMKMWDRLRG